MREFAAGPGSPVLRQPWLILILSLIWGDELKGDTIRQDAGSVVAVRKDPSPRFAESAKQKRGEGRGEVFRHSYFARNYSTSHRFETKDSVKLRPDSTPPAPDLIREKILQ